MLMSVFCQELQHILMSKSLNFEALVNKCETGAFAAMAILGKMDQVLAPKGISMTIAPLGAVCAVLFASPSSPAARVFHFCSPFLITS